MVKYFLFITAVIMTAVLINRYNTVSWWIACIASAVFFLFAMLLLSPIIAVYFLKDTILTMVYAIKEELE